MNRNARAAFRAVLVLLVLAAVAGAVYYGTSVIPHRLPASTDRPFRPAPPAEQAPVAVAPAGTEGEVPPAAPADTPVAGPAVAAMPSPDDVHSEFVGFRTTIQDEEHKRDEVIVQGEKAVVNERARLYDILRPVVDILAGAESEEPLDVRLGAVRVTAQRAEYDEKNSVVRLFDDVVAAGEDFGIEAARIVFKVSDRTLTSDTDVRLHKDRTDEAGGTSAAMVVTGKGLSADLLLKKMTIGSGVCATLFGVSADFLAAGTKSVVGMEEAGDVLITSDGRLLYEHIARKVTFFDNVVATFGGRELRCDKLAVLLGQTKGKDSVEVTDIVAEGHVCLTYEGQLTTGSRLVWRNVTQMGELSGQPAKLTTPEFEITGQQLSFYRVNNRFQADAAGMLLWKAQNEGAPEEQVVAESPQAFGPIHLSKRKPLSVAWQNSMSYDAPSHLALFKGRVTVQQEENQLSADELDIEFDPATGAVQRLEARGAVGVRDQLSGTAREALCDTLVWDAKEDSVGLVAAEGKTVNVVAGRQSILSPRLVFHNASQTLECPAAGRVIVSPAHRTDAPAGSGASITVEWQKMMHFTQDASPVAMFSGKVRATRGEQQMQAESLRVTFDADMNPLTMAATGGATIDVRATEEGPLAVLPAGEPAFAGEAESEDTGVPPVPTLRGDRWRLAAEALTLDVQQKMLTSETPGELTVFEADLPTMTIAWQKAISLDLVNNEAEFSGDVKTQMSGADLRSEELRLYFDADLRLRHVTATGNAHFVAEQGAATWELQADSAEAVFGAGNELKQVIARGNVEVAGEQHSITAERLFLFLEEEADAPGPVVSRAVAERNVRVRYAEEQPLLAGGVRLEWNRSTDTYVLTGEPQAFMRTAGLEVRNEEIRVHRSTGEVSLPPGARPTQTIVEQEDGG